VDAPENAADRTNWALTAPAVEEAPVPEIVRVRTAAKDPPEAHAPDIVIW
jgi:hypothetical protein